MDAGNLGPRYAGWTVNMCYRRGNLYGFELIERGYPHYRGPSNSWVQMERARQALLVLAAGAWGPAVFTLPFARRWRRPIARVCLGAVVVAAVAWSVYPYRTWDHAGLVAPLPDCDRRGGPGSVRPAAPARRPGHDRLGVAGVSGMWVRPDRERERHLPGMRPADAEAARRPVGARRPGGSRPSRTGGNCPGRARRGPANLR